MTLYFGTNSEVSDMSIRKTLEELLSIVEIHQKNTGNNFALAEVEYAKELLYQHEIEKLTVEQGIIITGYTGVLACKDFSTFHKDVEKRTGQLFWTHQFADKGLTNARLVISRSRR